MTDRVKNLTNNSGNLYIYPLSAFEITIKSRNNKIEMSLPAVEWIKEALKLHRIDNIPISTDISIKSAMLPSIHNDPCDRIIIASALVNNMIIVIKEEKNSQYPDVQTIWE